MKMLSCLIYSFFTSKFSISIFLSFINKQQISSVYCDFFCSVFFKTYTCLFCVQVLLIYKNDVYLVLLILAVLFFHDTILLRFFYVVQSTSNDSNWLLLAVTEYSMLSIHNVFWGTWDCLQLPLTPTTLQWTPGVCSLVDLWEFLWVYTRKWIIRS